MTDNRKRILVVGAGFAGMWSALGAARLLDAARTHGEQIEVALIAPEPSLHMRPRLHEENPLSLKAPLLPLFHATGIRFIEGSVRDIRAKDHEVEAVGTDGKAFTVRYDKLVLASGSALFRPPVPGLDSAAFSIDQISDAARLEAHLDALASQPDTPARNTVVVAGGGFTGIEIAAELPARLRSILGEHTAVKVIVIEQADAIGPDLGVGPRPVIEQALSELDIEVRLNVAVKSIDTDGIVTSNGERINAETVIWTAGMRANALTKQFNAERDRLGRLHVDASLRVTGEDDIFAAGDVAFAATDDAGNHALMSCQHAMNMGRFAGHNVAADLIGGELLPYRQPVYVTCLELGPWGAVFTEGWDRQIKLVGNEAKALKRQICTEWIYPPEADRKAAFDAADPMVTVVA
ncbi:FAD-dependent pyridine nucleotide-disulfide oxidoreductase [Caballeronia sordidicola]|uniref:FAD-dependent pyridine nucleotide-disulfide oxidoreductase n=1 Tax=Caballeronia sordidicola TaxID=196367 RepID=A0A158IAR6_CABSO|nr:NAD(P)/FAD-dependent oxidoreductase [Caballeronia sordidicola]SAL53349.1 FAD-dependent pyridine nucleotide-disulfide oxidoreductase [Caballeronia sordidicola]